MTTTSMNLSDVEHHLSVSGSTTTELREKAKAVDTLEQSVSAACDGAPDSSAVGAALGIFDGWSANDDNLRSIWSELSEYGGSMDTSALSSSTGLDVPDGSYSPFNDAMFSLEQIRDILDTARQDRDDGLGEKDPDQIWSVNDLIAMTENEKGYYTAEQVAHAKKVLAMIEASPEAREYLGITESGGGWSLSDIGHLTLDIFGMVPIVGNAADGINAAWYAAEGEWLDAALSSMALLPVVGQAVTLSKPAIKAASAGIVFKSLDDAMAWAKGWLQRAGILKGADNGNIALRDPNWKPPDNYNRLTPSAANGSFTGPPGNSDFIVSDALAAKSGLNAGEAVTHVNGVPDFLPHAVPGPGGIPPSQFKLPADVPFSNSSTGMAAIHKHMAELNPTAFPNQTAAKNWLSDNGLTAHHFLDGQIQLVPRNVHDPLSHFGGSAASAGS